MTFHRALRRILDDPTPTTDERRRAITALILATIPPDLAISPRGDPLTTELWRGHNAAHRAFREAIGRGA